MEELGIAMLDDAEWTSLEKAVDALEESWQTSGEADLTQLVPPPDDPLYSQALVQLIKIDQEYRYRAGFPKPLEAYLDEWPGLTADPDLTAELLATECQTRIIVDTPPNDQELRTRFPVIAARIDLAEIAARVERESRSTTDIKEAEETGLKAIVGPIWPVEQPPARYQIREVLGRGGMGTVYRAYDTQLDREVALKVPCIDLGDDPAVRERFFREAKAVARISHPNVCQVFDAGESGGGYYIAMALIEGQSLAARLQQGSLDCRQAAELVCKLARALGVVHAGGIIHRDLKPQNVMLDTQGEPLLTDFGLARPVQADGHLTGTYSLLGTPAYMSPEQMHGDPAGTTSDIYALGVILYQVLTAPRSIQGWRLFV
ncbi:MAG: protein kinase [Planctomycetia bacterium]|nr:protein kinase [Planctomycetia bacterium]